MHGKTISRVGAVMLPSMPRLRRLAPVFACALIGLCVGPNARGQDRADPFALLRSHRPADAVPVPPRALAVIPERHVGRMIRVQDELLSIDPQFDEVATGAGLDGRRAIQLRTREARVPVYVAKNDSTISTLLEIRLGTPVEFEGILVERAGRYLFLAASVRARSAPAPTTSRR